MKRNNIAYIVFIAVLNSQFYSNYSISCLKSTPTIAYVTSCPKNKLEWDNAASRKKCDSIAADLKCADTTGDFQYHCLMNQWQNATIEVCANRFYLQGYCAVYDTHKHRVAENYNKGFECLRFNDSHKCPPRYPSTDAYKYQMCYRDIYSKPEITSRATPTITTTEQYKEQFTKQESRSGGNDALQNVFLVLLSLALIIVLLLFLWRKRKMLPKKCKNPESPDEVKMHNTETLSARKDGEKGEKGEDQEIEDDTKTPLLRKDAEKIFKEPSKKDEEKKEKDHRAENLSRTQSANKNEEISEKGYEATKKEVTRNDEKQERNHTAVHNGKTESANKNEEKESANKNEEKKEKDDTILKTPLLRKDAEKNEKDIDNKRTPDALNQSRSDEVSPQSNSDNKTTPLDEKNKREPSSMPTKQAASIVPSLQNTSSVTKDKPDMPMANTDAPALSSSSEFPPPSISELSSRPGIKSPSSNLDVESPSSTSHMGDSANTSGYKTKIFVPSKPDPISTSEKDLPLSSEPKLVSDSSSKTNVETVNIALTEPSRKDEEKKEKDMDLGKHEKSNVPDNENTEKKELTFGKSKPAPPPPNQNKTESIESTSKKKKREAPPPPPNFNAK